MKKIIVTILFILIILCSAYSDNRTEFCMSLSSNDVTFNPHYAIYTHEVQIFTALYEGLFTYDPQTLNPVNAEAESWTKSDDGLVWTFTIRDDAKWADGTKVSATDYKDTWLHLINPETKGEYSVFFDVIQGAKKYRNGEETDPNSVAIKALDDNTLEIKLESPVPYLTRLLCHSSFVPIHKDNLGKQVINAMDVIGNGPYKISTYNKDKLEMQKDYNYWDRSSVKSEKITVLFYDNEKDITQLYNDGEIDWLSDISDIEILEDKASIQIAPIFATGYYFWNCDEKPWNDARVRRALTLLVPWDKIRTADNYYSPTNTLVLPFFGYSSPEGITKANEEEAKELLQEAGFPKGKNLPSIKFVYYESESHNRNLDIIEQAWSSYGIKIEKQKTPSDVRIRDQLKDGFTLSFTSWIGDFADPAAFLLMWASDSGLNESKYKSEKYDSLLKKSQSLDGKDRLKTLSDAENKLLNDAVIMPLYHSISLNIINTESIKGWYNNPLDIHPFKYLSIGIPKAKPLIALY